MFYALHVILFLPIFGLYSDCATMRVTSDYLPISLRLADKTLEMFVSMAEVIVMIISLILVFYLEKIAHNSQNIWERSKNLCVEVDVPVPDDTTTTAAQRRPRSQRDRYHGKRKTNQF